MRYARPLKAWKRALAPCKKAWAEAVKKAGGDPDALYKDFQARSPSISRVLTLRPVIPDRSRAKRGVVEGPIQLRRRQEEVPDFAALWAARSR